MGALVMLTLNQHHARPTRYRMASAMLYAHEACFLASLPALQDYSPIRARDPHAYRLRALRWKNVSRHA
jgi:hypothetical protein